MPFEVRRAFGKQLRGKVSRLTLGNWTHQRERPVVQSIREMTQGRLKPLVPIKFSRMRESPFAFFRGTAHLMASDLVAQPTPEIHSQICGDAHIRNLGAAAGQDGVVEFDLNDFDETVRGPWEWDLKRLVSSVILGGRESGCSETSCEDAAGQLVKTYQDSQLRFASISAVEVARYRIERGVAHGPVHRVLKKAERQTTDELQRRITTASNGTRQFVDAPPAITRATPAIAASVTEALAHYRQTLSPAWRHAFDAYSIEDVGNRVAGIGSVGLQNYVALLRGPAADDMLFLQLKEEPGSCFRAHSGDQYAHQGQRVVEGHLGMRRTTDPFLGWTSIGQDHFLVRQLAEKKETVSYEDLRGDGLVEYAKVCGELLARAHARTGDPGAIAGYVGKSLQLVDSLVGFAVKYADQVTGDYEVFLAALRHGILV